MKDCITTFSKTNFNTLNPNPDEVKIEDIAHALSLMCRANGHFPFNVQGKQSQGIMFHSFPWHVCFMMQAKPICQI